MAKSSRRGFSKKVVKGALPTQRKGIQSAAHTRKNPLERKSAPPSEDSEPITHMVSLGVRCDTDDIGHSTPQGRSPFEIVVDASEGFVPLWSKETTLRWRFRDSSFRTMQNPAGAKATVERLFAEALLAWGDAAPIKFAQKNDAWDFEIVMKDANDCNGGGCVLASAFFPDAGRHQLYLYPKMFEQKPREQVETLIHEIGHIFGLRHFFAVVQETAWPSEVFGTHSKFSIMNYGPDSRLTENDKTDVKRLYQLAWSGQLKHINNTPIKFVRPFHESGVVVNVPVAVAAWVQPTVA